ncbi:MAG: hypothetical protein MJ252_23735, partial [archaeon]|nr:hypothetical protein [archaeon]
DLINEIMGNEAELIKNENQCKDNILKFKFNKKIPFRLKNKSSKSLSKYLFQKCSLLNISQKANTIEKETKKLCRDRKNKEQLRDEERTVLSKRSKAVLKNIESKYGVNY